MVAVWTKTMPVGRKTESSFPYRKDRDWWGEGTERRVSGTKGPDGEIKGKGNLARLD